MPPAQAILNDSHTPNSPTLHTSYSCWQCRPTPLGLRAGQAAARGPGGQTPRAHQRRLSSPVVMGANQCRLSSCGTIRGGMGK
eukprot:scaffold282937_cov23-Tisochrysis_lutea.AAC.1